MNTTIQLKEEDSEFIVTLSFEGTRKISFTHSINRPVKYEDLILVLETIVDSVRDATERDIEHFMTQLIKRRECRDCGKFKHRSEGRYIKDEFLCFSCNSWYEEQFGDA